MQAHMGFIKNYVADGLIKKNRLITFGAEEGHMAVAGVGDVLVGTSGIRGAAATGDRIDVYHDQIRPVEYGAAVAYGDPLTADAEGRAIKAEPAVDASLPIIGRAMEAGGVGAIGSVFIQPSILYG